MTKDVFELIDEIRRFLLSSDQRKNAQIELLAKEYAEASREVNARLGKCARLLRQGLKSESLHAAREKPDLIDVAQAIEFAERSQWIEIVDLYDLESPPDIDLKSAEFLQAAYADDAGVHDLLRAHRLLAVARGPVKSRLAILRKLKNADADNPIWLEDIKLFENERINEIKSTYNDVVQSNSYEMILDIYEELTSREWSQPIPVSIVHNVGSALEKMRKVRDLSELKTIADGLNKAYHQKDEKKGRESYGRWKNAEKTFGLSKFDPLYQSIESAVAWLDEIDRKRTEDEQYAADVRELETAIENEIDFDELNRLYQRIADYGRGFPYDAYNSFVGRVQFLENRVKRKKILVASSAIAGMTVLVLIGFAYVRYLVKIADARDAATAIAKAIDTGNLDDAKSIENRIAKNDPGLLKDDAMVRVLNRLKTELEMDESRSSRFRSALEEAKREPLGPGDPPSLIEASLTARSASEKKSVERFSEERKKQYSETVERSEETFGPLLEKLYNKLQVLEANVRDSDRISSVRADLSQISSELTKIGGSLLAEKTRRRFFVVNEKAKNLREELGRYELREKSNKKLLFALTAEKETTKKYLNAVRECASLERGLPRAENFNKVLDEERAWSSVVAWRDLTRDWISGGPINNADLSASRAQQCSGFIDERPDFVDIETVKFFLKLFQAQSARKSKEGPINGLRSLFSDPLVDNVYVLKITENESTNTYYSKTFYSRKPKSLRYEPFHYLIDFDCRTQSKTPAPQANVICSQSPQSKLAILVLRELDRKDLLLHWDKIMLRILKYIADDVEIDPILKITLLKRTIKLAGEGSIPLSEQLKPIAQAIIDGNIDTELHWMDPFDMKTTTPRRRAFDVVKNLTDWEEIGAKMESIYKSYEEKIESYPVPLGVLLHDGEWICRIVGQTPESGRLFVVVTNQGVATWKQIGKIDKKSITVAPSDLSELVEGRIVFFSRKFLVP